MTFEIVLYMSGGLNQFLSFPFSRELHFVTRHHDTVPLWKLLCSGLFPLLYNIQMQWPVSIHLSEGICNMRGVQ